MPILDHVLSVVTPHNCVVCGDEGVLLCKWCLPDALPALPSRCYHCQRLSPDSATCPKCLQPWTPRRVWIVTDYENTAKDLVHNFKFERMRTAGPIIGRAMSDILPYIKAETLVVPVPTATARIRQRGYDHAELLAREIAKYQQLQWSRAVSRLTQSRQVGASRQQRITQLRNAFMVSKPGIVKGADILIVDDVVTTGATLEAMTAVLKQAGAKTVTAVVFAQKQ